MSELRKFENMRVWQESRLLVKAVRSICKREIAAKDWPFIDQITRAVRSISANIAEGSDAMSAPAFINFLGYAKRSSAEVRAHLYDALDEGYIDQNEFNELAQKTMYIGGMLSKLIQHLQIKK